MKATVNSDCISCGICVEMVPDVFEMGSNQAECVADTIPEGLEDECRDAAEACPVDAIEITDE